MKPAKPKNKRVQTQRVQLSMSCADCAQIQVERTTAEYDGKSHLRVIFKIGALKPEC